jgi:hypothetical protein
MSAATPEPKLHRATRGSLGRVVRGAELSEAEAIAAYRAGNDIVVCGGTGAANRALAQKIANAVGPNKRGVPHQKRAGPHALPHFQPDPRPPDGHVFYETDKRKAALSP